MSNVNHPGHYGGEDNLYEAIKVIEAWGLGFHLGNAVKYISRAGKKDPTKLVEDLDKAIWYLQRFLEVEFEKRTSAPETLFCKGCKFETDTPRLMEEHAATDHGQSVKISTPATTDQFPRPIPGTEPCLGCVGLSGNHRKGCKYKAGEDGY